MEPDPEAVRRALAEIEGCERVHRDQHSRQSFANWMHTVFDHHKQIQSAARAWLAQQDGEASE